MEAVNSSAESIRVLGRNHCVEELVGEFVHGGITRQVLLKTIGISCDRTDLKRFMKEVRLLRSLHHENIGQIYGVALHYSPIILVLEFFPTSLLMHLKRNRGRSSATEKRRFVCEAAAGLAYLADLRCVHRDIAARNCMLDDSRVVKISGFSLCEPVNEMHDDPSNIPIAVKWQAPEVLENRSYSLKSDVWSFGVLTWEVYSDGSEPYGKMTPNMVKEMLQNNYRMDIPNVQCPLSLVKGEMKVLRKTPSTKIDHPRRLCAAGLLETVRDILDNFPIFYFLSSNVCGSMDKANSEILVLVTGASGYIASHCVRLLLNQGYRVRGTVRSLKNEKKVAPIRRLQQDERLELVEADLMNEECWKSAVSGCQYILHIASPFLIAPDASCIDIAVTGTLNVLRAASKEYSVKKVVITSSCVAVNEGHPQNKVFDETSWTDITNPDVDFYSKSKTLAEKAAWDFVDNIKDGNKFALTTLNPTFVVGPLLIDEEGASISLMRRFINGEMPAVPELNLACVDVRDVAKAHVEAMIRPESDGERILITSQPSFFFRNIARILGKEFRRQGFWVPHYQAPYFVLWLYSFFDKEAAASLKRVGRIVRFDNSKAKRLLGIEFSDPARAMIEMGYSLIERGIVKKRSGYKGVPDQYKSSLYENLNDGRS
ncbi:hypothetical protein KIN20_027658 [Parelaphostrongylus tenuis]|uniref:Protein kinase domain-containing protein n=1 Tax=Parelaphostrongylus tenuis TaxID=148309 RepID=A0AAD5WE34_PARTN|nr:hypothetical protein KIN20_027658 [Parelaphostrongylus tenuis]